MRRVKVVLGAVLTATLVTGLAAQVSQREA